MGTTQPSTKDGNIVLREFSLPDSVRPGESVTAEVEVSNGALAIGPFDPDRCGTVGPGYKTRVVVVHPDGTEQKSDTRCHGTTEIGTKDLTYSITLTPPETSDTHYYSAFVEMVGSGETTESVDETVTVTETTPERSDDSSQDDGSGEWDFDTDMPGPDSSGPFGGNLKVIGMLLVVIAVVAAVGGAT